MTHSVPPILALSDAGHAPDAIASRLGVPISTVYSILRRHRPDRPRKMRRRTSDMPYKICALAARGIAPQRIAILMEVSRAYVYKVLRPSGEMGPPPY